MSIFWSRPVKQNTCRHSCELLLGWIVPNAILWRWWTSSQIVHSCPWCRCRKSWKCFWPLGIGNMSWCTISPVSLQVGHVRTPFMGLTWIRPVWQNTCWHALEPSLRRNVHNAVQLRWWFPCWQIEHLCPSALRRKSSSLLRMISAGISFDSKSSVENES